MQIIPCRRISLQGFLKAILRREMIAQFDTAFIIIRFPQSDISSVSSARQGSRPSWLFREA